MVRVGGHRRKHAVGVRHRRDVFVVSYDQRGVVPVPTDVEGFRELNLEIKRTNSRLTFLTARLESFSHLTRKHLNFCGVAPDTVIHYSSSKGQALRTIAAKYPTCKNVIFVDDKPANLEDVRFYNPSVLLYRWILKKGVA